MNSLRHLNMRDVDKTTLQKQKLPCFIITGKRLSGRPSGASSSEIGQKTARTSFLPEIVQKSASDGRPAGRRGLRAPSDLTVLSEGNQRDSPCKPGRTNTFLPPLSRLHSLAGQPARVDKSSFKRSKSMLRIPDNMSVLKPLCVSIEPITRPQKTGNAFTERPRLPSLVSQPVSLDDSIFKRSKTIWRMPDNMSVLEPSCVAIKPVPRPKKTGNAFTESPRLPSLVSQPFSVDDSTFKTSKTIGRMPDNMSVLEPSCVAIKPVPRPKKTGNALQRPGCSAYPCHDISSDRQTVLKTTRRKEIIFCWT
ncbi:uncharacterized protein LOC130439298 [Triplophysa dalaica]|uniref:uncharacterized protein LOC130439298 n=1 Tax=Triplophysa dalaica TaxID=1582913 RepID=UPI0024E0128F|nr:uncharacterized protein LOC130439298 [Triplophysa dalaica]